MTIIQFKISYITDSPPQSSIQVWRISSTATTIRQFSSPTGSKFVSRLLEENFSPISTEELLVLTNNFYPNYYPKPPSTKIDDDLFPARKEHTCAVTLAIKKETKKKKNLARGQHGWTLLHEKKPGWDSRGTRLAKWYATGVHRGVTVSAATWLLSRHGCRGGRGTRVRFGFGFRVHAARR